MVAGAAQASPAVEPAERPAAAPLEVAGGEEGAKSEGVKGEAAKSEGVKGEVAAKGGEDPKGDEPKGEAATEDGEGEAEDEELTPTVAFHGALEAYYAYNFNRPSNGETNWRWYDYQHNLLGLQGLWFATEWGVGPVAGHFQLQLGALAELFWGSERDVEQDVLWRLLQEATMEWKTPWRRLSLEGGLFNVPFGPEYNIVSKNWNWSGSNLFALMPYQIAGFRLNLDLGRGWIARVGIYNGWDRIVRDNNRAKSAMGAIEWTDPDDEENYFVAEYMIGDERDRDDERGRAPRHTFDVYAQWHVVRPFFLRAHTFSAIESGKEAGDGWFGGALYAKVDPTWWLALVGRGDLVHAVARTENLLYYDFLDDPATTTTLGAGTFTVDLHPRGNVSLRLEARHDRASFPLYYKGTVPLSDPTDPRSFVATSRDQTTLLAGMTAWF